MFTDLFKTTQMVVSLEVTIKVAVKKKRKRKKKRVAVTNNNEDDDGYYHVSNS